MSRAGESPERIAVKLKIPVDDVESLVKGFEAARASVSSDIIDMVTGAEYVAAISGSGHRLQVAQSATRFTGAYDANGDPIYEPDHQTAIEAIKAAKELGELAKPRAGGSSINIGINNQPGGNGNGAGTVKTFEQRVREKRGVLSDGDVKFLSDGKDNEVIDGDIMDDDELEDDELADDGMMDGTSDSEIEEADEARD